MAFRETDFGRQHVRDRSVPPDADETVERLERRGNAGWDENELLNADQYEDERRNGRE